MLARATRLSLLSVTRSRAMAPPVPHVAAMSAHHGSGSGPVSAVAAAKANPRAFASHQKRHQHQHQQPQASQARSYTLTALGRWSVQNKQLPPVEAIKAIHVYDFDNTCTLLALDPCPPPRRCPPACCADLLSIRSQYSRPRPRIPSSGTARR